MKLEAKVIAEPKPDVIWSKDGEAIIPDGNRIRIINEPDGSTSLVINNAYPNDKGHYSCSASNPLGTKKTEGDVEIKSSSKTGDDDSEPRFVQSLCDVTVNEGDSLKFEGYIDCKAVSDIKWYKSGERLQSGSNIIPSFDGQRVCLEIRNCGPLDDGEYECRVSNSKGIVSSRAFGIVRPRSAPKFVQKLSDSSHSSRLPVTLSCRASGNPEPEYDWYHNGKPIQSGMKYRAKKESGSAVLIVSEPSGSDSGSYECRARNMLGMDSTKCNLRIR